MDVEQHYCSFDVNRYYCSFIGGFCSAPETRCYHWQGTFCELFDIPERNVERSNEDGRKLISKKYTKPS